MGPRKEAVVGTEEGCALQLIGMRRMLGRVTIK